MAALTASTLLPQRLACAAGARRQCSVPSRADAAPPSRQWAFSDAVLSRVSAGRRARCTASRAVSRQLRVFASSTADAGALPASLKKIVTAFQMVPDPMQRYKQLLFYASKLKAMPDDLHTPDNKVQGCVSQVWVHPELREDGRVYFQADSDSQLTKGLAALLVEGLSGCLPDEVIRLTPDFIEQLGLKQSLTPSRNNGFLNMLRLMQKKTLVLAAATSSAAAAQQQQESTPPVAVSTRPVYSAMVAKLSLALKPVELHIADQSHQHAGHVSAKGLGRGTETHFAVTVVSAAFEGLSAVARHRLVYATLQAELDGGVHALTIDARTPQEAGA